LLKIQIGNGNINILRYSFLSFIFSIGSIVIKRGKILLTEKKSEKNIDRNQFLFFFYSLK